MFSDLDVAIVFNSGNAPFVAPLKMRGIPVAVHVDGLEAERAGRWATYYAWAERSAVTHADAVIADALAIGDYVRERYGRPSEYLPYGAPIVNGPVPRLAELGLSEGGYHLTVARFEPENHVLEIVRGYRASAAELPLIVVGAASYSHDYAQAVEHGPCDERIQLLGSVWDQELLDQLYCGARSVLHGHSVGGTNLSLLRAMGAGAAVRLRLRVNREVTGGTRYGSPMSGGCHRAGTCGTAYRWEDVIDGYAVCAKLVRR